jgi:hypothetical protein
LASQSKDEDLIIDPFKNSGLRPLSEFLWAFQAGEVDKPTREAAADVRERLSKNKIGTPKKARGVASDYKSRHGGRLAEEGLNIVGLVRIGFKVHDFAEKGDFVWIVRFGTGAGVAQELWISSTTGKVRAVLPPWPN